MTFSTAMNLSFDGVQREVDFVAWLGDDGPARVIAQAALIDWLTR